MKIFKIILSSIVALLLFVVGGHTVFAGTMNFSITPVLPSNQARAGEGYFDLLMKPNAKQTIEVQVQNTSAKQITVDTIVSQAATNSNGVVEYQPNSIKADATLKYKLTDYVKAPAKTVIPAGKTVNVKIDVTMPEGATSGYMAGGLTFKQDASELKQDKSKSSMAVNNEYQYVIALLMRQSTATIAPKLQLNGVTPTQVGARNVITTNLQNTSTGFLNYMNVNATVTGISNKKLKYDYANAQMQMAPNSNFNLPIPVSMTGIAQDGKYSKPMEAGKYKLHLTVYGQKDANGQYETTVNGKKIRYAYRWEFDRDFEITANQAKKLNAKDVTIKHDKPLNIWWLIAGALALVLVLILVFVLLAKRRKKAEEEENEKAELQARLAEMEDKLKKSVSESESEDKE
ncbi:DUF916 and DUF3324 domain-containing protein [Lactococcus allomyrinae]|uniref:DUF916 and DUF3324 domain-containing protein n=1 Tax=Lactococcus allomyrinae TaxID=2419773 RepID=A0A387BB45_9LACT|nr:DUF916 and DUF3324 domain-containing protein [Lactococcus allomyrinae]AYG01095.1 DUF916 and DUF3324 domain-containing protein [Lactococcus allomyrinae]